MLREHLGYLSDKQRLLIFQQALGRTVKPGDLIADVGCGFGVLGLFCLEHGAKQVFGIDQTTAIEIARETMERAGLSERYVCIAESSFQAELPELVDIIVCDHVGYFGIDYGIIKMIRDASTRFLRPGGRIVPAKIRLLMAGVSNKSGRQRAEAWKYESIPSEYHWLSEYGLNTSQSREFEKGELRTNAAELGMIDLEQGVPDHLTFKAKLEADQDGIIDGICGWFECELSDGVWMTNSPLAEDRISRDQIFLPFEAPLRAEAGDVVEITIQIRHEDGLIAWNAKVPEKSWQTKQSNWKSQIIGLTDLQPTAKDRALQLNRNGRARRIILELVDGKKNIEEIECHLLNHHPNLFPTQSAMIDFVRAELRRNAH